MKKIISLLGILLLIPLMLIGCGNNSNDENKSDKLQVSVSISPLREFTEIIGGDKVEVKALVPNNVEAHDFELKTRDAESLAKNSLFIYNGAGMEPWVDDLKNSLGNSKIKFIDSSINSTLIKKDNQTDPHLWLSLKEAQNQCKTIMDALIEVDPSNKDYYTGNYEKYKGELEKLYNEYQPKFSLLNNKYFVTGHEAFGYLCRDFGLDQKSLKDVFGEGETTAKTYETLVDFCNSNGIKIIFSESTEPSKEAETLANEINGKVEEIHAMESKLEGKTYLEGMKENLERIYKALQN